MPNDDESIWISYNGEIYNHEPLRQQLASNGFRLRSSSDTEVILRGYEAWGYDVIDRLRGIFAVAILDLRPTHPRGRLLLARDHLGVKPLYYSTSRTILAFASEAKALVSSGLISRAIEPSEIVHFFLWGSASQDTIYEEVHSLPAGSAVVFELSRTERPSWTRRYWTFPKGEGQSVEPREARERVHTALQSVVTAQLVSDAPLGVFLSGGLDSSAVAATAREASGGSVTSCSVIFPGLPEDEGVYARLVAQRLGLNHVEYPVTSVDVQQEIDSVLNSLDLPSVDGMNTYFAAKAAKAAGLTVALSGLGGDELFGGYRTTFAGVPKVMIALRAARWMPAGKSILPSALRILPNQGALRLSDVVRRNQASLAGAYYACRGLFSLTEVQRLLEPEMSAIAQLGMSFPSAAVAEAVDGESLACWVSRTEIGAYVQNQLLRDTDVMSMAHSVEVRVPLLDHKFVEAVMSIPADIRFAEPPKSLLASSVKHLLPESIFQRRKQGFAFPFDRWFKGALRTEIRDRVFSIPPGGIFSQSEVESMWQRYLEGRSHWSRPWAVAVANHFLAS